MPCRSGSFPSPCAGRKRPRSTIRGRGRGRGCREAAARDASGAQGGEALGVVAEFGEHGVGLLTAQPGRPGDTRGTAEGDDRGEAHVLAEHRVLAVDHVAVFAAHALAVGDMALDRSLGNLHAGHVGSYQVAFPVGGGSHAQHTG